MGFGKAFGIGLVVFIVLNLVWVIIMQLLAGAITIVDNLTNPGSLITTLFGGASIAPFLAIMDVFFYVVLGQVVGSIPGMTALDMLPALMMGLYYLVPAIITAIICGRMAKKGGAFGAMLLIMIISGILLIVAGIMLSATLYAGFLGTFFIMMMGSMPGGAEMAAMIGMLFVMISMIVNGIFYGGIAAVSAKSEGY